MEINFRLAESLKDRDSLVKFLRLQSLGYPNYNDWVDRAIADLEAGWKTCMLGFCNGILVADLVYQPSKVFPTVFCELKNGRVIQEFHRGHYLSFMIRQSEISARKAGYHAMICDTRSTNLPIINMLLSSGYNELLRVPLYEKNAEDVVFVKPLFRGKLDTLDIKHKIISSSA